MIRIHMKTEKINVVAFEVTPEDKKLIRRRAFEQRLTIAGYCRNKVLAGENMKVIKEGQLLS